MELITSNLTELNEGISQLGTRIEQAVDSAIHGLRNHDIMFFENEIGRDVTIDRGETERVVPYLSLLCENRLPPNEITTPSRSLRRTYPDNERRVVKMAAAGFPA